MICQGVILSMERGAFRTFGVPLLNFNSVFEWSEARDFSLCGLF